MLIMRKLDKINEIIVHCAETKVTQNFGIEDVRGWHINERGWSDVGYHYYIRLNGDIEKGRPLEVPGAHVKGRNSKTIGICFEGGLDQYGEMWSGPTPPQILAFRKLRDSLFLVLSKELLVNGHRKYDKKKSCPNFNVKIL